MLCVADATIIYSEATHQSSAITEEMITDASLTCQNDDSTVTGLLDTHGGRPMSPIDLWQIHSVLRCLILVDLITGCVKASGCCPVHFNSSGCVHYVVDVHYVADSSGLLMTCENDEVLSVADAATTLQPSESTGMQILDEVTGLFCAVSSSSNSLQHSNPVDSFVTADVVPVLTSVNTNAAVASVPSQYHITDNTTDAAQQPSTSSDRPVLDNDTDGNSVPRMRKRNEFNWLCNKCKRLRNSGGSYVNKRNKWCKCRSLQVLKGHDACRKICSEKVSEDQHASLFSEFWKLGNFDARNAFLSRCVRQHYVQRRRPRKPKMCAQLANSKKKNRKIFDKNYSRSYYVNVNGCDVSVCKEFFLATFDISSGRLNRAIAKQNIHRGVSPDDARGR